MLPGTAGSGTMSVGPSVLRPSGETPTICRISGSRGGGKRASRSSSLRLRLLLIICLPVHFDFETTRITDLLSMIPEIFLCLFRTQAARDLAETHETDGASRQKSARAEDLDIF